MKKAKAFVLLCVLAIATPAHSADWVVVDDDIEMDMESFQKRYIKTKAQNLRWYNCKDRTMSHLPSSSMTFDRLGRLNVNDIQQRQLADLQFVDIPPDTVPEMIYDIACTTSLMQEVYSDQDITKLDMVRLKKEYHDSHFANFRDFMLSQ